MRPTPRVWAMLIVLLAIGTTIYVINRQSGEEPASQTQTVTDQSAGTTSAGQQTQSVPDDEQGSSGSQESLEPSYTVDGIDSTRPAPVDTPDRDQLEYRLSEFARIYYALDTSQASILEGPGAADNLAQQFIALRRNNVQSLLEKHYVNEVAAQLMRDAVPFNSDLGSAADNATLVKEKIVLSASAQLTRYDAWVKNGNPAWLTISPLHVSRSYSGSRVATKPLPEILSYSEWQYTAETGWTMVYFWS